MRRREVVRRPIWRTALECPVPRISRQFNCPGLASRRHVFGSVRRVSDSVSPLNSPSRKNRHRRDGQRALSIRTSGSNSAAPEPATRWMNEETAAALKAITAFDPHVLGYCGNATAERVRRYALQPHACGRCREGLVPYGDSSKFAISLEPENPELEYLIGEGLDREGYGPDLSDSVRDFLREAAQTCLRFGKRLTRSSISAIPRPKTRDIRPVVHPPLDPEATARRLGPDRSARLCGADQRESQIHLPADSVLRLGCRMRSTGISSPMMAALEGLGRDMYPKFGMPVPGNPTSMSALTLRSGGSGTVSPSLKGREPQDGMPATLSRRK